GSQFLRFVFSYFQVVLLNSVGQYAMYDLRREIYEKLQNQEISYYDRNPVGRIITRLTADVDALNELLTSGVTDLLGDLVMIVAIIAVMIYMDWRLTLITLLTVPLLIAATTWFRKGARRGYDLVRKSIFPARKRSRFSMRRQSRCVALRKSTTSIATRTSIRSITTRSSFRWSISSVRLESLW